MTLSTGVTGTRPSGAVVIPSASVAPIAPHPTSTDSKHSDITTSRMAHTQQQPAQGGRRKGGEVMREWRRSLANLFRCCAPGMPGSSSTSYPSSAAASPTGPQTASTPITLSVRGEDVKLHHQQHASSNSSATATEAHELLPTKILPAAPLVPVPPAATVPPPVPAAQSIITSVAPAAEPVDRQAAKEGLAALAAAAQAAAAAAQVQPQPQAAAGAPRGTAFKNFRQDKKWLLPPLLDEDVGKKCLVLDLDETLVHSSFKAVPNADFIIPVEIDGQIHNVFVLKRPGVDVFLQRLGKQFEVVVFTASLSKYADPVLDMLDKHRVVQHRLFREACLHHKGNYVKDLGQLGRDLKDVIILDNSPASYIFHPTNAVPISSWFNDPNDTELLDLIPFLEDLKMVDDVMAVLANDFSE
ncbi:hypothetical protein HDU67_009028 [Dinochytrium kinnereticum]|nr:hypothetical protein HDU67_009028 [Dinochytrium kinnereticum]